MFVENELAAGTFDPMIRRKPPSDSGSSITHGVHTDCHPERGVATKLVAERRLSRYENGMGGALNEKSSVKPKEPIAFRR
jgi:hypothetical protein